MANPFVRVQLLRLQTSFRRKTFSWYISLANSAMAFGQQSIDQQASLYSVDQMPVVQMILEQKVWSLNSYQALAGDWKWRWARAWASGTWPPGTSWGCTMSTSRSTSSLSTRSAETSGNRDGVLLDCEFISQSGQIWIPLCQQKKPVKCEVELYNFFRYKLSK